MNKLDNIQLTKFGKKSCPGALKEQQQPMSIPPEDTCRMSLTTINSKGFIETDEENTFDMNSIGATFINNQSSMNYNSMLSANATNISSHNSQQVFGKDQCHNCNSNQDTISMHVNQI